MKRIIISEEEKNRILGMHVEATKRHYGLVNEQALPLRIGDTEYRWDAIKDEETLDKFKSEANNLVKIETLLTSPRIYGSGTGSGGGLDITKTQDGNSETEQDALRNIVRGLDKVAQLGRKVNASDIEDLIINTSSKYEPGKIHSTDLYANLINQIAEAISKKLNLEPKLS